MSLERSGSKERTPRRMERRTEQQLRGVDDRIDGLNPSSGTTFLGGTVLVDIEISNTAAEFEHGLKQADNGVGASARYVARAWRGAWVIDGQDGTFQLITSNTSDDTKTIGLQSDIAGPFTVTVAVI